MAKCDTSTEPVPLREGKADQAIRTLSGIREEPFTLHALSIAFAKKGDKEKAKDAVVKLTRWQPFNLDWAIENRQVASFRGL